MVSAISRIGLGAVQLGMDYGIANTTGKINKKEASQILKIAFESGIDLIDTASAYGNSEKVIGSSSSYPFKIVSKWIDKPNLALNKSLNDLKTNSLYGWLAHDISQITSNPGNWDIMLEQKEKGVVRKIGFSIYEPEQLEDLLNRGYFPDIIQIPFNFFDRRFESWFEELNKIGCEIHTRSAFLQGLFFLHPSKLPAFFEPVRSWLKKFHSFTENNTNRASFLLSFVLSFTHIKRVIIGVDNVEQLTVLVKQTRYDLNMDFPPLPDIPSEILNPSKWKIS